MAIAKTPAAKKTVAKKTAAKKTTQKKTLTKGVDQIQTEAQMHPPVIASVPDISVAKNYISRYFDNGDGRDKIRDHDLFDYCFENSVNLLIEGPTGPGKTMATRAWAAQNEMKMARIPSNSAIEPSQLFGKYVRDPDSEGFLWIDGPVTHVWREGGVILWNEINMTPERVGSVMFGALDDQREIVLLDHRGETIRAHRGKGNCWCSLKNCDSKRVLIVADQNPGYSGTRELNAALRDRFEMQLWWDYDTDVEKRLVGNSELHAMAKKFRDDASYVTPVTTRMLASFERIAIELGIEFAVTNFINHFRSDEREAVKLVVAAHKAGIEADLAYDDDDDDDDGPEANPDDFAEWDADTTSFSFTQDDD